MRPSIVPARRYAELGAPNATITVVKWAHYGRLVCLGALALLIARPTDAAMPVPGQLDVGFAPSPGTDDTVNVIVPQPDGKIIMGGQFTYNPNAVHAIMRFSAAGQRDSSFQPGSGFGGTVFALAIQTDGKILVGGDLTSFNGYTTKRVVRLMPDGALDSSFVLADSVGIINDIEIQPSGKIVDIL